MVLRLLIVGILLVLSVPALAAHPLYVDDAGTVDPRALELELTSSLARFAAGTALGRGAAARIGLTSTLDSGIGATWFDVGETGSGYELVLDVKFAPGRAAGWRPRPFTRADFALAGETDRSFARLCAGLTWEPAGSVLTVEACWSEPQDSRFAAGSAWSAAGGAYMPVHRDVTLALEIQRGEWGNRNNDLVRAGALTPLGAGSLSLGAELQVKNARFGTLVALLGWTTQFGG